MSTSSFQTDCADILYRKFPIADIIENSRPEWLTTPSGQRLELDFLLPQVDVAIEVQGKQHATFVKRFHCDQSGYQDQIDRDRHKRSLCEANGIKLFEVWCIEDMGFVVEHIASRCAELERQGTRIYQLKHLISKDRESVFLMYDKKIAKLNRIISDMEAQGKNPHNYVGRRDKYLRRKAEQEEIFIAETELRIKQIQAGKSPVLTHSKAPVYSWMEHEHR